jgi:hypothetical protein
VLPVKMLMQNLIPNVSIPTFVSKPQEAFSSAPQSVVFYNSPQRGYPAEFADLTLNHHEFICTPNQSIRMKMLPKKYV